LLGAVVYLVPAAANVWVAVALGIFLRQRRRMAV
jgi:hypothetical protein